MGKSFFIIQFKCKLINKLKKSSLENIRFLRHSGLAELAKSSSALIRLLTRNMLSRSSKTIFLKKQRSSFSKRWQPCKSSSTNMCWNNKNLELVFTPKLTLPTEKSATSCSTLLQQVNCLTLSLPPEHSVKILPDTSSNKLWRVLITVIL